MEQQQSLNVIWAIAYAACISGRIERGRYQPFTEGQIKRQLKRLDYWWDGASNG